MQHADQLFDEKYGKVDVGKQRPQTNWFIIYCEDWKDIVKL